MYRHTRSKRISMNNSLSLLRSRGMERSRADGSSPIAHVDEIQKRLIRPPSVQSQSSHSIIKLGDHVTSISAADAGKKRGSISKRKLEDYLDPFLLSTIRAKIGRKRKPGGETKSNKDQSKEFEWPMDELKLFTESWKSNEAVDLNDDRDLITGGGGAVGRLKLNDGDHEMDPETCTPFRRFEKTALDLFKSSTSN